MTHWNTVRELNIDNIIQVVRMYRRWKLFKHHCRPACVGSWVTSWRHRAFLHAYCVRVGPGYIRAAIFCHCWSQECELAATALRWPRAISWNQVILDYLPPQPNPANAATNHPDSPSSIASSAATTRWVNNDSSRSPMLVVTSFALGVSIVRPISLPLYLPTHLASKRSAAVGCWVGQ